mmetsp:Transcript_13109/g.28477  ORF Transcript_13109/g.28477 Transcript_13109/m.28477 type:complete len:358 (+) Transcript_13109:140-1213(+)
MVSTLFLGIAIHASFLFSSCRPFSTNHNLRSRQHDVSSIMSSSTSSSSLRSQVLDFIEPTTGVPVKLIGAMHYNPASIKLATDSINELAAEGKLGSIIIESCDIRWNATLENELVRKALLSEMKASHDLGIKYQRPVVLGDQRINITVDALKSGAKEAVLDLVQPWNGGWGRLIGSISLAQKRALPSGDEYLGGTAIFDPKLLFASPVSFIKYPLSYLVKSPVLAVVLTVLVLLSGPDSSDAYVADSASTTDIIESLGFSALETVIFARIFLKELLADRNEILATNILEQCQNYKVESSSSWLDKLFQTGSKTDKSTGATYAPGSVVGTPEDGGKTVVAVLGLAHLNGIKKILSKDD